MIVEALFLVLSGAPTVSALVASRIYPVELPEQPMLPAITYQRIASVNRPTLASGLGLMRTRFQVDCRDVNFKSADALRSTVISALAGLRETVGDENIQQILPLDSSDLFDHDALQFVARVEFYIWH